MGPLRQVSGLPHTRQGLFSVVQEATCEVSKGPWKAFCLLKKPFKGPRLTWGSCWKERKRNVSYPLRVHWFALQANQLFFLIWSTNIKLLAKYLMGWIQLSLQEASTVWRSAHQAKIQKGRNFLNILSFEFSPESMSEKLVSKEFCEIDLSLFCLSLVRLVGSPMEVLAGVVEVLQVGLITESVLGVSPKTQKEYLLHQEKSFSFEVWIVLLSNC